MKRARASGLRRSLRKSIAVALLAAASCAVPAAGQSLPFVPLTPEAGLAGPQVWDVFQDSRGWLWLATSGGLTRWDGFEPESLTASDGFESEVVRRVVEGVDGELWMATSAGLVRWDGRSLSHLGPEEGIVEGILWDLVLTPSGDLWFGSATGLGVRTAAGTVRSYTRAGGLVGLLLMDIDCFKQLNDTRGHLEGDECLRRVAGAVRDRVADRHGIVARSGGEELAVILPRTDREDAAALGEVLRRGVEELAIEHPGSSAGTVVTISVGAAAQRPEGDATPFSLVERADEALYRAKEEGRKRVEVAVAS